MNVEKIEPRMIIYRLSPNKEDAEYSMCMWAKFIFDCDSGQLNINSDAGDYSYRWGYNEHEDFMHLMARINKGYLIDKISSRNVFKLEESKKETIEEIKENGIDYFGIENEEELSEIIESINDIWDCGEEGFYNEVNSVVPDMDFEAIHCKKDYPYGAKIVCDLFKKYIQPKIKEDFEQ